MSNEELNNHDTEVQDRTSTVGMSKASKNLMVIGIVVVTIGAFFYIFSSASNNDSSTPKKDPQDIQRNLEASRPVAVEKNPMINLPVKLPTLPDLVAPPAPPSYQPRIEKQNPSILLPPKQRGGDKVVSPKITAATPLERKRPAMVQDRNTQMLVIAGSSGGAKGSSSISLSDPTSILSSDNLNKIKDSLKKQESVIDENAPIKRTESEQVKVTYIGDRRIMLAQGKIIDAVLETAINTDLKGMLRAVVSRDIYSESGKNILLPKGSRLIGTYDSSIGSAQVRVNIIWQRIIRPDGLDIQLDSPGTDSLGRAGIAGKVDSKFAHLFMNSILVSSIKVAGGVAIKKLFGDQAIKKETIGDKLIETSDPVATLSTDAVNELGKAFETVIKQYESSKPTITINQGTLLKVFLNKDLVFSNNLVNKTGIIN